MELDERLWHSCGGWGELKKNQTDVMFPVLFLFSKTDEPDGGACPLLGGVTHDTSSPQKPLCLALEDTEFFVHLHSPPLLPPLLCSWSLFYYRPFLIHVYHIM